MSKTLPEKMADILIQGFANAFKTHNINTKEGVIAVTIKDSCKNDKTRIGRAIYIQFANIEFSLAIDALKEYYRPYRDSELDACIMRNVNILLDDYDNERVFITNEEVEDFITEMNEALAE